MILKKELLQEIFDNVKENFNLDIASSHGYCCTSCTVYEFCASGKEKIIYNKFFLESELNNRSWSDEKFVIGYNNVSYEEMNEIGKYIISRLQEKGFNYEFEELNDNYSCLVLKKIGGVK